jgi:hypothetical protein
MVNSYCSRQLLASIPMSFDVRAGYATQRIPLTATGMPAYLTCDGPKSSRLIKANPLPTIRHVGHERRFSSGSFLACIVAGAGHDQPVIARPWQVSSAQNVRTAVRHMPAVPC